MATTLCRYNVCLDEPMDMPDGSKYMAFRVQGSVQQQEMDPAKYPFDVQKLIMEFEDLTNSSEILEYAPDANPITISGNPTLPGYPGRQASSCRRPSPVPDEFRRPVGERSATVLLLHHHHAAGDPQRASSVVKIIVPIFTSSHHLAGFSATRHMADSRVGIGITAMLGPWWRCNGPPPARCPMCPYLMMIDLVLHAVDRLRAGNNGLHRGREPPRGSMKR